MSFKVVLLLAACGVMALSGCGSEKSTSRQSTHRSVGTVTHQSGKRSDGGTKGSSGGSKVKSERGQASYYADKFQGRSTASGEKYDKRKLTGAHRTLPFGTVVRVTNTSNGRSVEVRINDRGPFKAGRVVDVSRAAAEKLDMIRAGVIDCTVEVISRP